MPEVKTFDTAAVIAFQLDLVISGHRRRIWRVRWAIVDDRSFLDTDWRWLLDREDSPLVPDDADLPADGNGGGGRSSIGSAKHCGIFGKTFN